VALCTLPKNITVRGAKILQDVLNIGDAGGKAPLSGLRINIDTFQKKSFNAGSN